MPAAKKSAPTFGTVAPPKRQRKGGFEISDEVVSGLISALENANGDWIGDGESYATMGKAQAASQRFRKALVENGTIGEVKDVASRVWQDGDVYHFALRMRNDSDETSE